MTQQYYEKYSNFSPILNTANVLMRGRGYNEVCDIIADSQISIVNTDYDNWNAGTFVYTVYVNLSVKKYSTLTSEKVAEAEKIFGESLNEVSGDSNSYFLAKITPILSNTDIDWGAIGGEAGKSKLLQSIETVRNIMISVATGGNNIQDENDRYQKLHGEIVINCKKLNLVYNNTFGNLWDWYRKWKTDFPTWQGRRAYIHELFSPTLAYFEEIEPAQNIDTLVELTEWERIERTILKIKKETSLAKDEEDFQGIGLLCRDVIISLAQAVYNPLIHGETDENGTHIGASDAVRMLTNYINYTLHGKDNKELRDYIKTANAIANRLTHKRSATKKDMLLTMSSTISLINFIGIIEEKY
ncbi:MAG: hypothetical protein II260_08625 [Muribaculaceae bacterium]|nr:hypothetical protein [Muribaculaceae bacterium]